MSSAEVDEAVKRIKKVDDLNMAEAVALKEAIMAQGKHHRLQEEATDKSRIKAALNAMKELLKDRALPKSIRDSVEALSQAMKKNWDDLENDLEDPDNPDKDDQEQDDAQESLRSFGDLHRRSAQRQLEAALRDALREAINQDMSADQLVSYAQGEMWDIITAAQALIQMAQLRSECNEPDDIATVADIMTGICKFIVGEIVEMVTAAQAAGEQGDDEDTDDDMQSDDSTENLPMGEEAPCHLR